MMRTGLSGQVCAELAWARVPATSKIANAPAIARGNAMVCSSDYCFCGIAVSRESDAMMHVAMEFAIDFHQSAGQLAATDACVGTQEGYLPHC
jgi:hypothetical protein